MPVEVVIADDHELIVQGMKAALESRGDISVVGTAKNGIDAIALCKKLQPDMVLLDMSMPGATGVEVFTEVRRWSPRTRAAMLTGNPSPALFQMLEDAGVDGLFVKNSPIDEICEGILRIAGGERVISDEARAVIDDTERGEPLTGRELEVLQAIAEGLTNNGIADKLSISPKTVDNHRTSLMRKLGVRSTASLIVRAVRDGLVRI